MEPSTLIGTVGVSLLLLAFLLNLFKLIKEDSVTYIVMNILGAAIATSIALGTISVLRVVEVRSLTGSWPFTVSYIPVLLAGGTMAGATVLLTNVVGVKLSWVLTALIGLFIYAIVFLSTGLTAADREIWRQYRESFKRRRR